MRKLMDKIKKNNKGFTLVELIVVVAILAIITVVVAPQYLDYVEKARIGTDENTLGEIAHVAEIAYVELESDPDTATGKGGTVTVTTTGDVAYGSTALEAAVKEVIPEGQYTFVSKTYKNAKSVVISVSANGEASWKKLDPVD